MRIGAYDFVEKPIDRDRLLRTVTKAVEKQLLLSENSRLRERLADEDGMARLVGTSRAMVEIRESILQIAQTDAPVLITGESGTGKEVVADLIHGLGPRRKGPLVKISCAAIPDNLLESELFGYERGAFSGALTTKSGRFELANGGTLFLDEIGEMPGTMQAKLLRVLQDGCVQRLGSTKDIRVDTRVLSATNIDMDRALREGRFREDLYHRLNVFEIQIPPLRERIEDIPVLLAHYLRRMGSRRAVPLEGVTPEALAVLTRHPWPGNVRELENVVQRAVATAPGPVLTEADVRLATFVGRAPAPPQGRAADGIVIPPGTRMDDAEDLLIEDALRRCGGNKERAAQLLGVSARTLTRRAKRPRPERERNDDGTA
jgi:DNA-binding NtrC family response regulator